MKIFFWLFSSLCFMTACRLVENDDSYVQNVELGSCYENNNLLTLDSFNEDSLYYKKDSWGFYKMEVPIYWYNDQDELQAYSKSDNGTLTIFLKRTNTFEVPKEKCFRPLHLTLTKVNGISKIAIDSLEYFIFDGKLN